VSRDLQNKKRNFAAFLYLYLRNITLNRDQNIRKIRSEEKNFFRSKTQFLKNVNTSIKLPP
jgi:diacylglycerol kinase family enzyme